MTEQHSGQNDSPEPNQRHKIFGLEVIVVALLLFIAGLGIIAVSALIPEHKGLAYEIGHHLLRDLGIAAIISALLGSAYEYQLRSDFLADAEHALSLAVQKEREWLTRRFVKDAEKTLKNVLVAQREFLEKLQEAGLTDIGQGRDSQYLRDKITNSKHEHVQILETWTGLGEWGIDSWLEKAIKNGSKIKILLLDPDSSQVEYRAVALNKDPGQVKASITSDLAILERVRRNSHEGDIEIRTYDSSPSVNIFRFDDTRVFGLYLRELDSVQSPQFIVNTRNGFLAQHLDEHFESLWNEALDPRETSKVKALVEEATEEVGSESIFVSLTYKDGNYLVSTGIRVPPSKNFTEMVTRTRENIWRVLGEQGVSADDIEISVQGTAS